MQEKAKICKFLAKSYNWDVFGPKWVFLPAYIGYAYGNVRQDAREAFYWRAFAHAQPFLWRASRACMI